MREWGHGTFTKIATMSEYKKLGRQSVANRNVQFVGMNGVQNNYGKEGK